MSDFTATMQALCAKELAAAHGDAERMAEMLERLIASTGLVIAVMARGDPKAMSELVAGAEGHLNEMAADKMKFGAFMADARRA